jgi:signal transduction histidine kinase/ActR/RegA family two-component response regulator
VLIPAISGHREPWWLAVADAAARAGDVDLVTIAGQALDDRYDFRWRANSIYELVTGRRLDGLIVFSAALAEFTGEQRLEAFCRRFAPLPLVSIGQVLPGHPSIRYDVRGGMRAAVQHLITGHGYRRIGYLSGPLTDPDHDPRYLGYRDALSTHGIESRPPLASGTALPDVQALVAANPTVAAEAIAALARHGLRVPQDVAVVAFDDPDLDRAEAQRGEPDPTPPDPTDLDQLLPRLTRVRAPVDAIASRALDLVWAAWHGKSGDAVETLAAELVVANSCGCPATAAVAAPTGVLATATGVAGSDSRVNRGLDEAVRRLGQRLVTALDVGELTALLTRQLPTVRLPTCYVVLYDPVPPEGEPPAASARLLLAYENGRRPTAARGPRFPTTDLLPDAYLVKDQPRHLVVLPLYLKQQHLGLVIFQAALRAGWTYEALQGQIASAVQGGTLLRRERHALAAVEEGRRELEARVAQRTAELARANAELRDEIAVRQQAEETKAQLEEQLRQAQKMEAIGRLAGGVAHDFNNLLTVISGYSEMMLTTLEPGSPWYEEVEEIARAGQRAASLTRQLLVFSRQQVLQPQILDLNSVVANMDRLLRRIIGDEVQIVTVLQSRLPIRADVGQLEQIIVNLALNARDAMPGGGRLTIETGDVEVDEAHAAAQVGVEVGRYGMLRVTDTGMGMDADIQARIFEPFFTTKPPGHGTGLGLATVFGIVSQSGGHIKVDSAPGRGSRFSLYLPATTEEQRASTALSATEPVSLSGSETILLIEDDARVRTAITKFMSQHGYQVLEASDGAEGLRLCGQHGGPLDIIVSDVRMPGPHGPQLARQLTSCRPDTPILFISGYTDSTPILETLSEPRISLLQKPFTAEALARKIRQMLAAKASWT